MLDPSKELTIRTALGTKIAAITGTVFVRRPMIDSNIDWVEKLGVQNVDQEVELRLCTVDLRDFVDQDEGCDDDPVVNLSYNVHLFHEYKESRSDSSNSTDDFIAAVLSLRNAFLDENRSLGTPALAKVETLPLTQSGFIILGDDPLTGAFGHYIDLTATVEVK
jgi:hypothetical protein